MKGIALACVRLTGMKIFPVNPYNKHPLVKCGAGFCNASSDETQVAKWWTCFPTAMIGLPTGAGNGWLVVDVDVHSEKANGLKSLSALKDRGFELPETSTVRTPSGGLHCWFRYPFGVDVRSSAGRVAAGVDVRANGGFIVAPGSRRFDGGKYRAVKSVPPAEAPQWLVEECLKRPQASPAGACSTAEVVVDGGCTALSVLFPDKYRDAVFFNSRRRVAEAQAGKRNSTLFYNALTLYSLLAGGAFSDEWEIDCTLHEACIQNGLVADDGERSVRATMASAKRHGFRNPVRLVRRCAM